MAREIQTLAFVQGKGWVRPEATEAQEAERLAAYEATAAMLKVCKDRKKRKDLEVERRAHVVCAQECMVEVGVGAIASVDERARNTRVNINADHLNIPIHGYLDMTDFALWDQVGLIRANFGRCRYRIIVRRTAEVHPSLPWGEVEVDSSDDGAGNRTGFHDTGRFRGAGCGIRRVLLQPRAQGRTGRHRGCHRDRDRTADTGKTESHRS